MQGFIGDYNPNDDRRAYDLEWCAFTLWDTGRPVKPFLPPGLPRWTKFQETPLMDTHVFESGKVEVKMKVTGFDAADGFGRSQAEIFARQRMVALIYFLQTREWRGRVFDRHVLASVSRGIGVREERRIVGEHVLTNGGSAPRRRL